MITRHLEPSLLQSLRHFPVVLLTGARQVGKSTLVQSLCRGKWKAPYLTLDDRNLLDQAASDPDGLIAANPGPVAIDEIQRAPDLLRAIKLSVDRNRRPGRFLLTGSANVLTLKRVSETLAGRIALHELYPFSFAETLRRPRPPGVFQKLFESTDLQKVVSFLRRKPIGRKENLLARIVQGSYPTPFLTKALSVRNQWFEVYRKTYIERDIREIQDIERVPDFNRLLSLAASRTGQVLNLSDLGRDVKLPYVTLRRYMNLLEQTYQILLVPPFFSNVSKRLMKAPKLYWTDTGMACHLLHLDDRETLQKSEKLGAFVETWAAQELQKLAGLESIPTRLYGWRRYDGQEIDFLVERGNRFIAIEVKWGQRIDSRTLSAFQMLRQNLASRFHLGIILYGGDEILALGPGVAAVPFRSFFV